MMVYQLRLRNFLADRAVDLVAQAGSLFDARAGAGADVELELAAVAGGKEVLSQPRIEQRKGPDAKDEEQHDEDGGVLDAKLQDALIANPQLFKVVLEELLTPDQGVAAVLLQLLGVLCRAP